MQRVDIFTPIHKAVRSMIYDLGRELQIVDFTNVLATSELAARLQHDFALATSTCVLCLLHEHAGNEDKYVFPQMRQFEPEMVEALIQEHGEIVRRLALISKFLAELQTRNVPEDRIDMGIKANQMVNDLFAFYLAHLDKEERTILPATWRYLSDEQLIGIRVVVERNTPPERYAEWMRWVFSSLNANELAGMFAGMKQGAPPTYLERMMNIAVKSVPEDRWRIAKERAGL